MIASRTYVGGCSWEILWYRAVNRTVLRKGHVIILRAGGALRSCGGEEFFVVSCLRRESLQEDDGCCAYSQENDIMVSSPRILRVDLNEECFSVFFGIFPKFRYFPLQGRK